MQEEKKVPGYVVVTRPNLSRGDYNYNRAKIYFCKIVEDSCYKFCFQPIFYKQLDSRWQKFEGASHLYNVPEKQIGRGYYTIEEFIEENFGDFL